MNPFVLVYSYSVAVLIEENIIRYFVKLDSLSLIMFTQKPINRVLMIISMNLRRSSACNIHVGVLFREFVIYLKNSFCRFSIN